MMLVYALALSVAVGYIRGGRLRRYEARPLRLVWLPLAAFSVEALYGWVAGAGVAPSALLRAMVPLQYALLAAFCTANWRRRPTRCIAAGAALNLLVIGLNDFRMPVTPAIRDVPQLARTLARIESGELFEYVIAGPSTRLAWLGDVIAVPLLPSQGYGSVGDILLAAGVFLLVMEIMMSRDRRGERHFPIKTS